MTCKPRRPGRALTHYVPVLVFAVLLGAAASAQEPDAMPEPDTREATPIPLSYTPKGAPQKSARPRDLGHAAIVAVGSLPFTVFYVDFAFDAARFAANGFDLSYAPWPFKNQYSAAVSTDERFLRIGVSVGFAALVGLLDYLLLNGG